MQGRGEEKRRVEDVPVTFRDVDCAAEASCCSVAPSLLCARKLITGCASDGRRKF